MTHNLFRRGVQAPVKLYRAVISPLFGPSCRYTPTCSAYMLEALEKHGIAAGLWLGLARILRCNPWVRACGHDPVPEAFDWRDAMGYKRPSSRKDGARTG